MKDAKKTTLLPRPPVVVVVGHVDHGKTTLLDTIRKTNVAQKEFGGITQKIGAYQISYQNNPKEVAQLITFIDTPGHQAFTNMRSRGAQVADIAILVVAADDSVKPQTIEAISQVKKAGIPMLVAINKIDLPSAQIEKVKKDLAKHSVQLEGFGGEIPWVGISAKHGTGISDLLEMIILVSGVTGISSEPTAPLSAVVIETRLDKGKGMVADVIVKKGTIHFGTSLYEGQKVVGKVRSLIDEQQNRITEAGPSKPVEILGFSQLPQVGASLSDTPYMLEVFVDSKKKDVHELPDFLKPIAQQEQEKLHIILKADTAGGLEAIQASLDQRVKVVASSVGAISENDVLTAKSTKAFVVGFAVKVPAEVMKLAQTEKVVVRTYPIIYELLDELAEVVSGMKELLAGERELGIGTITAEFPFNDDKIAGVKVLDGRFAKGDTVKIIRNDVEIGRAKIKTVRQAKQEVTKVEKGQECGILLDKKVAFLLSDGIIAVTNA